MTQDSLATNTHRWLSELQPYRSRLKRFPFAKHRPALLVIDMQRYFAEPGAPAYLPASRAIVANVKGVVNLFRSQRMPVVFTRHAFLEGEETGILGHWWADVIRDESAVSEIIPELRSRSHIHGDERVIRKTRYSAFLNTDLEEWLRTREVTALVVTGVMTHLCCETTARDGFMRDFVVYFTVDGTASSDEKYHLASLRNLSDGFAIPVSCDEVNGWLRDRARRQGRRTR